MAVTQNTYTGDGSTRRFSFTFPYLDTADIKVSLDGSNTTAYSFASATEIEFDSGSEPGSNVAIRIYRQTDDSNLSAEFYPGSAIRSQDLNDNFTQNLYINQETERDLEILDTYVNDTFVEDTRVLDSTGTWSDTDDVNIPTAKAIYNKLITSLIAGFWDGRYYTESELNGGKLDTRYYTETELTNGALDGRYYTETESLQRFVQTPGSAVYVSPSSFGWANTNQYVPTQLSISNYLTNKIETSTDPVTTSNTAIVSPGYLDQYYYKKSDTWTRTEADARYWNVDSAEYIDSGDTWTPDDQHIATTAAIEARIVTLVDDVGGFVPLASYTDFPTSNPDPSDGAGTVISIQNVSGLDVDFLGFTTNATTTAGTQVTIYGFPSGLSFPLADDFGMLVVTTATPNWYQFHRLVAPASDVIDVASNATNINTVAGQISPTNNVATVAGIAGNITTTAGISSSVTAVAGNATNINTVAGISGNVTTVAGISAKVTTVANNDANVTAVANNASNINTVSGSIANVNTVGGSIANVNTVATNVADVITVAADITDVTAVSTNIGAVSAIGADLANSFSNIDDYGSITGSVTSPPGGTSDIQTVATNIANVNTVAGNDANITTVAGISANVTTVAGNTTNINAVAADATDIGIVAAGITNVNAVGTNIASVNTAATNISAIIAAPTEATNAANSASAAATSATNAATSATNSASSASAAATSATNAATSASNASTSASNASSSATAAAGSASNAATSATAAATSETNAASSEALALQYRDDTAGILTQSGSDAYNVSTNQAWGDIISSVVSHFDNEILADTLLTMSKGTNTYIYGTL